MQNDEIRQRYEKLAGPYTPARSTETGMTTRDAIRIFVLVALLFVLLVALLNNVTIFEDGSWTLGGWGSPIGGCLPWGLCN